jgi:hypothetical protein
MRDRFRQGKTLETMIPTEEIVTSVPGPEVSNSLVGESAEISKVEKLGPKKYTTTATATPRVLVVFCGDPRFQGPIRLFLEEELGLKEGQYLPFVIRGGPASFTVSDFLPKEAKYVTEGATNYVHQFKSIDRVVLINHEDCGKYKLLQKAAPFFYMGMRSVLDRQVEDLTSVAKKLVAMFPRHLEVDKYMAKFANSERTEVIFEKQ